MPGNAERAGVVYFLAVFAIGFLLGAFRVVIVEPGLGPTLSVAIEMPVMLTVSWIAARMLVERFAVGAATITRLRMGTLAVFLLVVAETLLGLAFGRTLADQFEAYGSVRGVLTLVGQVGFALIPLFV